MKIRRTTSKTSSSPPPTTQHRRRKSAADRITPILPFPSISSPLAHSLPKTFCTPPPPHSLFTAQARVPMVLLHVRTNNLALLSHQQHFVASTLSSRAKHVIWWYIVRFSSQQTWSVCWWRHDYTLTKRLFSTPERLIAASCVFLYVMLYLVFVLNNFFVRKIKGQGFE